MPSSQCQITFSQYEYATEKYNYNHLFFKPEKCVTFLKGKEWKRRKGGKKEERKGGKEGDRHFCSLAVFTMVLIFILSLLVFISIGSYNLSYRFILELIESSGVCLDERGQGELFLSDSIISPRSCATFM